MSEGVVREITNARTLISWECSNDRAYLCQSIAIDKGDVSRYFSKVPGPGVDLTPLNQLQRLSFARGTGRACLPSDWPLAAGRRRGNPALLGAAASLLCVA